MPAPPIAPDVDLRNFLWTPIARARLFGSAFHVKASDAEWRAGMTLWLKSWDQVPAGSLPSDDVELCHLAEFGRDLRAWRKVKPMAMLHWEIADDGRLYHHVVTELVTEAWDRKTAAQRRTEAARAARHKVSATENVATTVLPTRKTGPDLNGQESPPSAPPGDRGGRRRRSPITNLWEGAYRAAEAISDRDEAAKPRDRGD